MLQRYILTSTLASFWDNLHHSVTNGRKKTVFFMFFSVILRKKTYICAVHI